MRAICNLEQWQVTGKKFAYKAHEIFYREAGKGRPVVLLHGFPTASWDWHSVWPPLVKDCQLVALDFIGYGFSEKPENYDYSTFDQADLVEKLLSHLGYPDVHILAHDYGNTVAQELLARELENSRRAVKIRSVCFLNGGLFIEAAQPRLIQKLLLTPIAQPLLLFYSYNAFKHSFRPLFGAKTRPTENELEAFWQLINYNDGKSVIPKLIRYLDERKQFRARWVWAMQNASIPLKFICGTADPVSGLKMAERYRQLIPDPDVCLLDGIGHYPQVEAPEAVVREVMAFTQKQS